MDRINIYIINSIDQLKNIHSAWNNLLNSSKSNTIFLTWEWQYSWVECFLSNTDYLFVVIIEFKDKIIGIAPWYIRTSKICGIPFRQLYFIGGMETASDYLDVIAKKDKEQEVAKQLYSFLFSEGKNHWDSLMFRDISSNSLFLLQLQELIAKDGKYAALSYSSFCPATNLPTSKENFLLTLSPNRRQQYKRHTRILQKDKDIRLHSQTTPTPNDFDTFFSFYENNTGYSSRHVKPMIQSLAQNSKGKEIVQIDTLLDGDLKIASLLHLKHEHTMSMYLMVIDKMYNPKISIGNIIVGMCMENAIKANFYTYDFLKGTESYKFHWANTSTTLLSLLLYQRNLASTLLHSISSIKNFGKFFLR